MINSKDYEDVDIDDPDNPELTDEDVARMRPFKAVFPDVYEQIMRAKAERLPIVVPIEEGADEEEPARKAS